MATRRHDPMAAHRRRFRAVLALTLLVLGAWVAPPPVLARHGTYTPSFSDYGGVGLLQTRNARFGDEGLFSIGASTADPYNRYFFSVHILDGLEVGFRYTTIQNRDIINFNEDVENTAFQDKGADIKHLLLEETARRPAVAIGLQDFIGTAQFSAEYIVASKRYYDLDFTLGMGWGRLATRGLFKNPLTLISKSFESRGSFQGDNEGGQVNLDQLFAGEEVALFGGIEWLTPLEGLRVKIEYDPNNYKQEPLSNTLKVDSSINIGVAYQPFPWIDLAVGFERGNTLLLRVAMTPNLINPKPILRVDSPAAVPMARTVAQNAGVVPRARTPALDAAETADRLFDGLADIGLVVDSVEIDGTEATVRVSGPVDADRAAAARVALGALPPPIEAVVVAVTMPDGTTDTTRYPGETFDLARSLGVAVDDLVRPANAAWTETARRDAAVSIIAALKAHEFDVEAVDVDETSAIVFVSQGKYRALPQAFGRAARAVAAVAPPSIEEITVVNLNGGLETARATVLRTDLERALALRGSPEETLAHTVLAAGDGTIPASAFRENDRYPAFSWSLTPQLRQHVGGTDALYLFQLWARLGASIRLTRGLSLHGAVGADIYNNFDEITNFGQSNLPRVRSLVERYLQEGENNLVELYATYGTNLGEGWYGRVSAGIFEEMYAGISGEILYRPFDSRLAVGLDINHVFQRDFEQLFGFFDYDTTTGHLSLYYDTPFQGLHATVRMGRYLARDIGATFELSREFEGGITLGAFATLTNVSAEEFGEGSFDKGFFVSIPLDLFFLRPTSRRANFSFRPLTRDGGQFVSRPQSLYGATGDDRSGRVINDWSTFYD